jgi:apolipoprotein N-acyltransferase
MATVPETTTADPRASTAARRAPADRPRRSLPEALRVYAPPLATALLLWLSFFPVDWGWLGWVALVPLLTLIARPDPRRVCWAAFLGGLLFALPALQWIRLASAPMYFAWIGLALVIGVQFALFVGVTRRLTLRAGVPLLLAAPVVWTFLEYLRANITIGFAWYYLGHTQHEFLAVIQLADLFGAYGVSFLVMLVNVALFQMLHAWWGAAGTQRCVPATVAASWLLVAALVAAALGYGFWRLGQDTFEAGPRLALVQGNLPQYLKNTNDPDTQARVNRHFDDLAIQAARTEPKPDLIVWSETSFRDWWIRVAPELIPVGSGGMAYWSAGNNRFLLPPELAWPGVPAEWQFEHRRSGRILFDKARAWQVPTLLGLNARVLEPAGDRKYNSALLVDAGGMELDRYDKIYILPFGEFIPLRATIPLMEWLSPYDHDYSIEAGTRYTVFTLPGERAYRFAVLICYEDSVPHLPPKFLRHPDGGQPPEFFINISNDGWFKGSSEHEQHFAVARFRAVECRRAVARAVNMGVTGIIDGNGRIVALPGPTWADSKNRTAIVVANVPLDRRTSRYVDWGDRPLGALWALVGLWWLGATLRRRGRPAAGLGA